VPADERGPHPSISAARVCGFLGRGLSRCHARIFRRGAPSTLLSVLVTGVDIPRAARPRFPRAEPWMLGVARLVSKDKLNICRSLLITERCSLGRVPRTTRKICWREPGMSDDACFHLQTFCGSLAPATGFPRDFFSRGSHWIAHVRTCACVSLSWYRHTQLVFSGGLAPLAAQRLDDTGTEQQGGPPLGRAVAWP
jgi:hypothetical protein